MKREKRRREEYEFAVIGGGLAGVCAAVAAARRGVKTVLVHARPVLGGNASSEIRMHICGADENGRKPELAEGGIINEIMLKNKSRNPYFSYAVWDETLYETVKQEKNLTVYFNTSMEDCEVIDDKIISVECYQTTTEYHIVIFAEYFADCTGNGTLGFYSGAEYREGSEAKYEFNEPDAPEKPDGYRMGNTILFKAVKREEPVYFTPPTIAKKLTDEQLKFRIHSKFHTVDASGAKNEEDFLRATTGSNTNVDYGYWWIELSGKGEDFVGQYEDIKDDLIGYVWGMWDHIKNGGEHGALYYDLVWVGALPGMRESRRLVGDYILTENDVFENRIFDDAVAYGGWPIDIHTPNGLLDFDKLPSEVISFKGAYTLPWRCYYSKNIKNLTFAGRDISLSRLALGSARIMGTCAVGGQAVGTAIAFCKKYGVTPRELQTHICELQQAILEDDGYIPGVKNTDEDDYARKSVVTCSSFVKGYEPERVVNGFNRKEGGAENAWRSDGFAKEGEWLCLDLGEKRKISRVQLTFDSSFGEPIKITLSDNRRSLQSREVPETLVKDFAVSLYNNGKEINKITVENNVQRLCRVGFEPVFCDTVKIWFYKTRGCEEARVFEIRIKNV